METVKACPEKIVAKTEEINTKQKELEKLLKKKPKNRGDLLRSVP